MKTFLLSLFTLFFFTSCSADSLWLNDYNKALKVAKKQDKDIYLFIAADTCKFCKRFKEVTLSKKHVMDRLQEEYILVYLSRDQHVIPKGFSSEGVPRHYFLTKEGKVIFETFGMPEPDGFFLILDEVDLNRDD